ncbi:hypothetical protein NVP1238A_78 [Vibrio phage 1.238.A._10N.261.52.F10]|uniref:Uncharacterized protein n=1 Tax=Vibrio phage 1.238.A._10N.261.52.F10 TaxID=1881231 RepID=A0A2I7RUJ7_9CAUD|nr:hypothetical protein KNT79_gp78 [Vibrio phage 1.238.A._10N.261.52.F10]AUR97327.1 hypothetical protein NVP1238A_78 [Vibrio phage 1.238.A._10N.261.52.F10]AUR97421.1 hypothetical protein NVP1238B_79 [Vibrio phage 1.238.B._10N.261.52.F10]
MSRLSTVMKYPTPIEFLCTPSTLKGLNLDADVFKPVCMRIIQDSGEAACFRCIYYEDNLKELVKEVLNHE